jgi:acid phosphatase
MNRIQRILRRAGTLVAPSALLMALLLSSTTALPGLAASADASAGPQSASGLAAPIQHVFLFVMENKGYSQVWNTNSTPYLTYLGKTWAHATVYKALTHPSLPNYLEIFGGSNFGITTDCSPSSSCHTTAKNLGDRLSAAGLTWKAYMESMPSPCYLSGSGNYAPKHNPAIYFDDIRNNSTLCKSHDVPYSVFPKDLASASTTPNFVLISPNLCSDMHSCSISTGDKWLTNVVPAVIHSAACVTQICVVIITWDEDNGSYGNRVLTIFAGSGAKTGGVASSTAYNHYSLLRTIEYIFGLPTLTTHDAAASPMTSLLR